MSAAARFDSITAELGGPEVARARVAALSPATLRACYRIAREPGLTDPPEAGMRAIAIAEGARVDVVLSAMLPGREPEGDIETDGELAAALALAAAIDAAADDDDDGGT